MVYDCFLFFNELEILDIRLNTLDSVVDKFVICEATKDHANKPKPLYFWENREKFKKFKDKIIYIKVEDIPNTNLVWIHVENQWNALAKGISKCRYDDIILISDADEIPRPERILEWKNRSGKVKVFLQSLSYYYLNCVDYVDKDWEGTRMMRYKDVKKYSMHAAKHLIADFKISDGGWHFSFMGGIKMIQKKIITSGHQEFNTDKYNTAENIKMAISEGKDFLHHGLKFKVMDKSFLPSYVLQNQSKFEDLLIDEFEKESQFYYIEKIFLKIKYNIRLSYRLIKKMFKKFIY